VTGPLIMSGYTTFSHGVYHRFARGHAALKVFKVFIQRHANQLLHCKGIGHEGRPIGDCGLEIRLNAKGFKAQTDKAASLITLDKPVHQRQALHLQDSYPLGFCCNRRGRTSAVVEDGTKKREKKSGWRSRKIFGDIYGMHVSQQ